jgi:prepilin-type N-terminal cleavage/methylation domain-containing protein
MKRKRKKRNSRGFSLVEMLVVTLLLSVVSLAIFSTFSSALEIWYRINRKSVNEDLVILCHRLQLDLSNAFKFSSIDFVGTEERLEFASLVNFSGLKVKSVGKIIYEWDPRSQALVRIKKDYSAVYGIEEAIAEKVLADVKSLQFQYYFYDPRRKEYLWRDESAKKELPLAIRMEIELEGKALGHKLVRTFNIPAALKTQP